MSRLKWILLTLLFCSLQPLTAAPALSGAVKCRFYGKSSLEDFKGRAPTQEFTLAEGADTIELSLEVKSLDTGLGGRDDCMFKMFQASKHPMIYGTIQAKELEEVLANEVDTLPIDFKIHNKQKVLVGKVDDVKQENGYIQFSASYDLDVIDFEMDPPVSVFGVIKASPYVNVVLSFEVEG